MLEAYLRELEGELARRLPQEDVRARLAEVDAHLRDGIEGRVELGLDAGLAEAEAIRVFGPPREVARAMIPQAASRTGPRRRWLWSGYALGVLFFLFGYPLEIASPRFIEGLFVAWGTIGLGFAAASFRARRPAPIRVFGAGLAGAAAVWAVAGFTWIDLAPYGGAGVVPFGQADGLVRENTRILAGRRADRATIDEAMRVLRGPRGIEGLRTAGGYRAPIVNAMEGWDRRLDFTVLSRAEDARWAWAEGAKRSRDWLQTRDLEAMLAAIPAARADPAYKNLLAIAPSILSANVAVAGLAVLIDLVFGALGAFWFGYRRRSRGGGIVA